MSHPVSEYASALTLLRHSDALPNGILATTDLVMLHRATHGVPAGWWRARVAARFGLTDAARGGGARPVETRLSARRA